MPPISFEATLQIDGQTWPARRLDNGPNGVATFIPQVRGQRTSIQLDPLNVSDWSDGRGWGQNVDTSEGIILPGPQLTNVALPSVPGGDIEQFAEQDGHIYLVGGRYAYRIPNGSDPIVQDMDLGGSFVAVSVTPWKSSLIVGGRSSANIWEKPSGGAWTQTMVGGAVQRGKLTTVWWNTGGGNSLRLVGEGATPTALTYVAGNPRLDTDWQTPITIGSYPIRSMVGNRYHAYAVTTGGLFDFGSDGTAPNLTPDVERMVMDSNGRASLPSDGWVYFNAGYTLKRVNIINQTYAQPQDCGWAAQLPKECPMSGYCTALVKVGRWIWAFVFDGTNTWGIKGREAVSSDIYGPIVWFVAPIYLPGVKVTAAHVSGLVSLNPRLWMATLVSSTRALVWAPLPLDSAYRDLRQARPYRFSMSYTYDEPDEAHGDDTLPKFLREFVGEGENWGTGASVALGVLADGSSASTPIGTLRTSPRATVRPPTTMLASRYILRHTGSGSNAVPPITRKLSRRVIPRPDLLEVRNYQIVAGPAVRQSDGTLDGRSVKSARSQIARLQKIGPLAFRDEHQSALNAFVAAGVTLTEIDAKLGDADVRRVLVADIQVAVLATTGTTFKYGTGVRYGSSGKVWG